MGIIGECSSRKLYWSYSALQRISVGKKHFWVNVKNANDNHYIFYINSKTNNHEKSHVVEWQLKKIPFVKSFTQIKFFSKFKSCWRRKKVTDTKSLTHGFRLLKMVTNDRKINKGLQRVNKKLTSKSHVNKTNSLHFLTITLTKTK